MVTLIVTSQSKEKSWFSHHSAMNDHSIQGSINASMGENLKSHYRRPIRHGRCFSCSPPTVMVKGVQSAKAPVPLRNSEISFRRFLLFIVDMTSAFLCFKATNVVGKTLSSKVISSMSIMCLQHMNMLMFIFLCSFILILITLNKN